jgi:hypothetical protein
VVTGKGEKWSDDIDRRDRGLLLALEANHVDESTLRVLDEHRQEGCARARRKLRELDETKRARLLADWRAELASALPAGLSRLHPSWLAEALAGEPAPVLAAIGAGGAAARELVEKFARRDESTLPTGGAGLSQAEAREWTRLALGRLAPLCESECGSLAERLCALECEALLEETRQLGARTIGRSLAGAAPALRARVMAAAGEPWAAMIGAASAQPATRVERRAAAARVRAPGASEASDASERMLRIGLDALREELAAESPGSLLRVAGRLPAPLGRRFLRW